MNGLYDWIDRPDELPESISIGYDFPGVGPGSWFDNPFRGWYVFDGAFVRRALRCVPCTRPRRNP
ncbi:MAG: hypothetical protein U0800_03190 [Isosphaeraceae bacterium]